MSIKKKSQKPIFFLIKTILVLTIIGGISYQGYQFYSRHIREKEILKKMIGRLQAESRVAEVVVTDVIFNPLISKHLTTIKFLEYSSDGKPLAPRYFTFSGNIIQFQSLVVRFDDKFILEGDSLKGKSVYLFWKAFMLDGERTEEYVITPVDLVPEGYKVNDKLSDTNKLEEKIWAKFWNYAIHQDKAELKGIKNAQIEAPGTKFLPGFLYTLKIEHDGGIRIDVSPIPEVLKGEKVL
ncbi:MAG: hypothetical protein AB1650_08280 [Candidatus Omnitrophota bacterium]